MTGTTSSKSTKSTSTSKTTTAKAKTTAKTTSAASTKAAAKTTSKTTAVAPKTATPEAQPTPVVVDAPQSVVAGPRMRKRELIEKVVEKSGVKRKFAKPVVESMLAVLGEAISDGRELNVEPLGKVKVRRSKEMPNAKVMVTKIRQSVPKLSDAAE